ncbi:hypothetical protein CCACVL1_04849, partial [Corchorus capsularis]
PQPWRKDSSLAGDFNGAQNKRKT